MKKGMLIYQKVILVQFIAIAVIMAFFAFFMFNSSRNIEIAKMKAESDQILKRLTTYLPAAVWNVDSAAVDNFLNLEMKNVYVYSIIINQEGKFWTGKIKSEKGDITNIDDAAKYQKSLKSIYLAKKDVITYDNKEIGNVELYITDSYIKSAMAGLIFGSILQALVLIVLLNIITFIVLNILLAKPLKQITQTATRIADGELELQAAVVKGQGEIATLAMAFNSMTDKLRDKVDAFKKNNDILSEIVNNVKDITVNLNSSSKEIEAAAQEQTSASNEHASGVTEVSATLEELTITAKQITTNVGELVVASGDAIKMLKEGEKEVLQTVSQLDEVGKISSNNTMQIGELGKRSTIINEMVEIIKEVANKTNMLSINASIEASRAGESGKGFSVVAAEIRELSKETITSAKKVEKAAKEIQDFLNSIIISSESESDKVLNSGKVVKQIKTRIEEVTSKINNNYTFAQKIDVSIKQQENGSKQATETMRQMAEIARQSAETARQTLMAVKDIVNFSSELDAVTKLLNKDVVL